jgi:predicted nucleic acid-binding Zn ribbon protein
MPFPKRKRKEYTGHKVVDVELLVGRVLEKFKLADELQFQKLAERFQEVVGELIFPHVKPLEIKKGILSLKVDNSAWKSELFLQKKAIIDKCNLMLGSPVIQGIRFV